MPRPRTFLAVLIAASLASACQSSPHELADRPQPPVLRAGHQHRDPDVVSRFPNAVVADWDRVAPPEGFTRDGVHLNERGMQAMANLLAPLALRWRAAAEGGGPLSCRDRAEALARA